MATPPPHYILLSHSPLSAVKTGPTSSGLAHPIIQYQYQDDSPREFIGQPGEHVIIMDIDPASGAHRVRSISEDIIVSGLNAEEAPGAVLEDSKSDNVYTIETIGKVEQSLDETPANVQSVLAQFKQRNLLIRRVQENHATPTTNVNLKTVQETASTSSQGTNN